VFDGACVSAYFTARGLDVTATRTEAARTEAARTEAARAGEGADDMGAYVWGCDYRIAYASFTIFVWYDIPDHFNYYHFYYHCY
jgi:hypothetical protein